MTARTSLDSTFAFGALAIVTKPRAEIKAGGGTNRRGGSRLQCPAQRNLLGRLFVRLSGAFQDWTRQQFCVGTWLTNGTTGKGANAT